VEVGEIKLHALYIQFSDSYYLTTVVHRKEICIPTEVIAVETIQLSRMKGHFCSQPLQLSQEVCPRAPKSQTSEGI
jgi:hypothetical protein